MTSAVAVPKRRVADLAVVGGAPAFGESLHVGRPNLGDRARLQARIEAALDRRWLTNDGPLALELEERLADAVGARHCVAMANATVGLQVVSRALGIEHEVLMPSLTFVATPHALAWQGAEPIFCDVDPASHTLDPSAVERAIGPRTSGIIGVHLWGRACAPELAAVAERHGLPLVLDAAHALGCTQGGEPLGGRGAASVFSLHATKVVSSGEGGVVATDDEALADDVRRMKNFGFVDYDDVRSIGTNGKMSELAAALGLTSLEDAGRFYAVNRRHHEHYRAALGDVPGVRVLESGERERSNFQYVVLEVDAARAGLHRDELIEVLHAERVLARRYFHPGCHRMAPYRDSPPRHPLPVTERLTDQLLVLPTGTALADEDVAQVAGLLRLALEGAAELRPALQRRRP